MGCVNSKSGFKTDDDFVDLYNLDPASGAEFDLSTVGESWLTPSKSQSASHVPVSLLEIVDSNVDLKPQSWSEVSKALEELKPSIENQFPAASISKKVECTRKSRKSVERKFHRVEEFKNVSPGSLAVGLLQPVNTRRPVNPLDGLKEMCPPGGSESVVLYTTSLHGVRRTFDDCEKARLTVELQCPLGLDVDERDVSIHGEYLREMKRLLLPVGGEEGHLTVPRLFIRGRYVGGVKEIMEFNETRRLGQMLRSVKRRKEVEGGEVSEFGGRKKCGGCGGFRFVLCFECNGSRKVLLEDDDDDGVDVVVRCGLCNENGLVQCPVCVHISD